MWFKVDDKLHDHPKVQQLLEGYEDDALAAFGLWVLAGSWCGDQMSDGLISGFVMRRWHPDWKRLAALLVEVGLWDPVEVDGRHHHRFHDWLDYNDSRESIESDRLAKAMRVALQRDVALVTAIKRRDKDRCRYCGTQVDWRARRGDAAATYDHVKPIIDGGKNTLNNVVVCCKRCNDRKGRRSLREAGMNLLAPGSLGAPIPDEEAPASARTTELDQAGSTTGSGRVGSGAQDVPRTATERGGRS
jgi:hypothetical protein